MAPSGFSPADAADARTHEPRPESERALRGLTSWLEGRGDTAVIAGAPGAGTTFVLHRLESQERARRVVLFSPFLHIEAEALESWLDGLARAAGFASLEAWLAPAPAAPLLLVDEAHTAAPAALDALARMRSARAPQLRIVLGGCAGAALDRAAQRMAASGLLVLELPPWSEEDLRRLAAALCAVAPVDAATLVAAAEGSPELLRLTWSERRDRAPEAVAPLASEPPPAPVAVPVSEAPRERPAVARPAAPTPEPPRIDAPPIDEAPVRVPTPPPPAPVAAPVSEAARKPPPAARPAARTPEPPRIDAPPIAEAPVRAAAPPSRPRRRRALVPWFHAAALVIGFLLGLAGGWGWDAREPAREPVPEPVAEPALAAVAAPPPVAPAAAPSRHDVQVNALPWAWIRIDGKEVGVTPLVQRGLDAGPHEFEATFPDGRQERRTVEIGPDSRFVAFAQ
jgi:hypothetical protein